MDWICFGESPKGLLAIVQHEVSRAQQPEQLISLGDDLSVGDLSDLNDREKRAFGICPWKDDPEFSDAVVETIERYYQEELSAFETVDEAVIWYGDNPAEQCGMLRAAHDLYARGVPFSLVHVDHLTGEELPPPRREKGGASAVFILSNHRVFSFVLNHTPQALLRWLHYRSRCREYRKRRAQLVAYRGVGELTPEEAAVFYRKRRRVKVCEAKLLSNRWKQLVQENAPLRVMKDGKPVSAPADYYDEAILANTPETETAAARVVGLSLAECNVNDCLIFERIRALAAAGKLEIVKNGGNYRETTVKKVKRA